MRIEAGIPVSPYELNEQYNPLEARLMDSTINFTKGCYPGQEVIARLDSHDNVKQHLAGFLLGGQQPQNMAIEINGQTIGSLTSFGYSYDRKSYIGLGYIRKSYEAPGTIVNMRAVNDEIVEATVTSLPFL